MAIWVIFSISFQGIRLKLQKIQIARTNPHLEFRFAKNLAKKILSRPKNWSILVIVILTKIRNIIKELERLSSSHDEKRMKNSLIATRKQRLTLWSLQVMEIPNVDHFHFCFQEKGIKFRKNFRADKIPILKFVSLQIY